MQRTGLWVLLTFLLLAATFPISAQDGGGDDEDNLLKDGDFEGQYTGRGSGDLNIPADWGFWYADSPRTEVWMNLQPVAFPHTGPDPDPRSGNRALNINRGFATFTAAVYQQVSVPEGSNVQARAFAYLHTCDIEEDHDKCGSSDSSGGMTKIGIDPNGGTDVHDSDIVWSSDYHSHDRWDNMDVSATATGGTVTVFLYVTQNVPTELNKVYFDNARLRIGGEGGSAGGGGGGGNNRPAATPVPQYVGFVTPQEPREDGSIVHVVRSGDTLDSIAVAYQMTRQEIMDLNNISDPRIIAIGQELLIREATSDESSEGGGRGNRGNRGNSDNADDEATPDPDSTEAASSGDSGDNASDSEDNGEGAASDENNGGEDEGDNGGEQAQAPQDSAPPAPVVADALPARDAAATTASICVLMFDDANQNRIQEDGEASLAGGQVVLNNDGSSVDEFSTENASEPHCVSELAAGNYLAVATAPDGYGLTTPNQLRVRASAGATIYLAFGAAEGVVPAMAPPPDNLVVAPETAEETAKPAQTPNPLVENSGFIVLGLAGVVLVIGTGATLLMRRR